MRETELEFIINAYFKINFIQKAYRNNGYFSKLGIFWELIMSFARVLLKFSKNMCQKEFDTINPYFFSRLLLDPCSSPVSRTKK